MALQIGAPVTVKVSAGTFPGIVSVLSDEFSHQVIFYAHVVSSVVTWDQVSATRDDNLSSNNTWRPLEFNATVSTGD